MRCSCKACGPYMVQTERGLFSGMKLDAVTAEPADPPEWVERPSEWRKML